MVSRSRSTCATEIFDKEDWPAATELALDDNVAGLSNDSPVGDPICVLDIEGEYAPLLDPPPPPLPDAAAAPPPPWEVDCDDVAEANCESGVTVLDLGEVMDWLGGRDDD